MLFLVQGEVSFTPYMNSTKNYKTLRLVEASNENEASSKFEQYFENQGSPYGDSYSASVIEVSECIT